MRSPPRLLLVLLVLAGLALALFVMWRTPTGGVQGTQEFPRVLGGVPQGHVYTCVAEEPGNVNPYTTSDNVSRRLVLPYTHDALLDRDPKDGALRPALAESYEVEPGGQVVTFTLRTGVQFSDGSPLTMRDVMFGWELKQARHLPFGYCDSALSIVETAEPLDERRLRLTLKGSHFAGVQTVGEYWIVGNRRFFEQRVAERLDEGEQMPGVDSARFATLMKQVQRECGPGTGPYQLRNEPDLTVGGWRERQDLLLTRHESSWRRVVRPGTWNLAAMRVLFRGEAAGTAALLRGELDWFSSPMLDGLMAEHTSLERDYRRLLFDHTGLGVFRIVWNCRHEGFADPRVRRALSMLVKRSEIMKVFEGAARVAVAHARPSEPGYPEFEPLPFDPTAARKLLREAGYDPAEGRALRLRLLALTGSEPLRRILELFADACKQAGVELEQRPRSELSMFVADKARDEWDGCLLQQSFDSTADPYRFLHSEGIDNDGKWSDPDVDRWLTEARAETDPARRVELWRRVHVRVHELQPAALIVHPLVSVLLNRHIEGIEIGPIGLRPERAWVPPEFQRQ